MSLPSLSVKRPIFITCVFILVLVIGFASFMRLGVDLFPNVNFPIVLVTTTYSGAGPAEVESLVAKPLEDSLMTVPGVKTIRSANTEGASALIVEFTLDTDSKYAEQQVKDRITTAQSKLPTDADRPIVRAFDPADQPILTVALSANLKPSQLFDLADEEIRPLLEQVKNVGFVDVLGGRKREIHVLLDRAKLQAKNLSATAVVQQLSTSGKNIPAGKANTEGQESVVRTLGEYDSIETIKKTLVNFFGNEVPVQIGDLGEVVESLQDERTRSFVNGEPALTMTVYRRSGANTIAVADAVKKRVEQLNTEMKGKAEGFKLSVVQDGAKPIRANVADVTESIFLGILLTIVVVYLFLGSARSTFITGVALPNSLLGAFILMSVAGFTVNTMTLLAMSLAVGLLVDDAIVVRENIFRHIEKGKAPEDAAVEGTKEVTLAVVATTLTVIAVFGPVAFLQGVVGQFFKEFGLTICFAMMISLVDALTMAPMLSAYFAGNLHAERKTLIARAFGKLIDAFNAFQDLLERLYLIVLGWSLKRPILTLFGAFLIFIGSFLALAKVPKTFVPPQDTGEFVVSMELAASADLQTTHTKAAAIDARIRENPEVERTVLSVGGRTGESYVADIFVQLVPAKQRKVNTTQMKERVREHMVAFADARPKVQDRSGMGGTQQPLNINIIGNDMTALHKVAGELLERMKKLNDLQDVDMNFREGKPEFRVVLDKGRSERFGVSSSGAGQDLRTQIEGTVAAVFREGGTEYDIRVRLKEDQRNIRDNFKRAIVPNINQRLIQLSSVADAVETSGPSTIHRENRSRYIQISAALNPSGRGMGYALQEIKRMIESKEVQMPPGVQYKFVGQAENFQELMFNMVIAAVFAVLFIYLVLSSLYESFITPFTIMLVLPLAACGAFYGLFVTGASFDIFSMIGCIMLLGVATKNSILLVDYVNQQLELGRDLNESILEAGKVRLRPIIMTSIALIAGMLPVAIGLNEASKQRTSMGIAVIGGLITSTALTLVVVPAAYAYIERIRRWVGRIFSRVSTRKKTPQDQNA